jgi:bifunctional ADP-heptose synthase (sugar kinase/adenylyltransferase)
MEILAALAAVDYVVEVDDQAWSDFCLRLSPDVVVRGAGPDASPSDAGPVSTVGHCKVVNLPLEPGYSATQLIERIKQSTP